MKSVPPGTEPQPFVEMFPIRREVLPALAAYALITDEAQRGAERRLGYKLAYRLRQRLGGRWIWSGGHLVTDAVLKPEALWGAVRELGAAQPRFAAITDVQPIPAWQPDAAEVAEIVVRGWVEGYEPAIAAALGRMSFQLKHMTVEREAAVHPWVIEGAPALSVSVHTRLLYFQPFNDFANALEKSADLVGLRVADRTSTLEGEIIKVMGHLGEHRQRLIQLTQRAAMRDRLASATDQEWVVRVRSGGNEYDYIGSALQLVVTLDTASRFDVIAGQVDKALHLKPAVRAQLVKSASDVLKQAGLIGAAYNSQNAPQLFERRSGDRELLIGSKRMTDYDPAQTPSALAKFGLHTLHPSLREGQTLHIALLNALGDSADDFREALARTIERDFGLRIEISKERRLRVATRTNLETGVRELVKNTLQTGAASVMLVLLPDEADADDADETIDAYYTRLQAIGRGQPCLVVHASTMNRPDAMHGLIVGLLARAGSVPYLFDSPLPYCDRVVGLLFARETRRDSEVITGIARIFRSDGLLLRAITAQVSVPIAQAGELPDALIERLLPKTFLAKRRVLFHIDGRLTRPMLRALGGWEAELEATFLPVEVRTHGAPRIYTFYARTIESPAFGTMFRISEQEALLVTSGAPYDGTPQPLHLRVDEPLTIAQAADSIIAFTTLHYGALKRPKLPVTLHQANTITASIERGVHPTDSEASTIYWL